MDQLLAWWYTLPVTYKTLGQNKWRRWIEWIKTWPLACVGSGIQSCEDERRGRGGVCEVGGVGRVVRVLSSCGVCGRGFCDRLFSVQTNISDGGNDCSCGGDTMRRLHTPTRQSTPDRTFHCINTLDAWRPVNRERSYVARYNKRDTKSLGRSRDN